MKTEVVFEILAEGGGISIKRQKTKAGETFIYHHSEFDPTDEGLDVDIKGEYKNFDKPFQLIHNRYDWHMLYLETAHKDYRTLIIKKLIEKLNEGSGVPDDSYYSKDRFEERLGIKLESKTHKDKTSWSYTKTDK